MTPASRHKVETFNAYTLAYTRNFKVKKIALDSPRLDESNGTKYKTLF